MKKSFSFNEKPPRMPAMSQERSASAMSQNMQGLAQYEQKISAASEALQAVQRCVINSWICFIFTILFYNCSCPS